MASVNNRLAIRALAAPAGQRERNKAEKLRRIRRAARELFLEKGYDNTTTRAIARRAGVGLGTLFTYAADKRDLLFLICNDELELVAATAFANVPASPALVDQLIALFREFYTFFARQPKLGRFVLRELTFYVAGPSAARFQGHRTRVLIRLAELVAAAKRAGKITARDSNTVIAHAIFALYSAEIRRWLEQGGDAPKPAPGLRQLRRMLDLLVSGLGPPAAPP